MMDKRRWQVLEAAGVLGATAAGVGLAVQGRFSAARPAATPTATATDAAATAGRSAPAELAGRIGAGDARALADFCQRVTPKAGVAVAAVGGAEADDLLAVLKGLRAGYKSFAPAGRASAIAAAGQVIRRFAVEPAPAPWFDTLHPTHDLFVAGLTDPNVDVRAVALNEVGSHWNFLPGRAMTPAEESTLAEWKDAFVQPATRCLGDREPKSRAAAVACLGATPLDSVAAPAAAYVEDRDSGGVRYKALMTFASRPALLGEDAILKRLHDKEPGIPELAEIILKGRGLSPDQIYLGRRMGDPRPEVRAAVIPVIRDRTDIDPVVWLVQLSHDADDAVRAKAAEALATRESPEVDRRLREMADSDASPAVRSSAARLVAQLLQQATAALPALPPTNTTTGLTIRAN